MQNSKVCMPSILSQGKNLPCPGKVSHKVLVAGTALIWGTENAPTPPMPPAATQQQVGQIKVLWEIGMAALVIASVTGLSAATVY